MSDLLRAIEHAAVRGWPAFEIEPVDGWLWRHTSGGSIRANTVATLDWSGRDLDAAIARVEALYGARHAPAVFTISDVSQPVDLDVRLAAGGYARGDDHVTMAKAVDADATLPPDCAVGVQPTTGWMVAYLSGLSVDRRAAAPQLIAGLPASAVFVSRDHDGGATSSGLTVIDGDLASVQCMATLPAYRRRGSALAVLGAIEAIAAQNHCRWLYLQTGGDNLAAQALYARCGFDVIGRYHTRTKELA